MRLSIVSSLALAGILSCSLSGCGAVASQALVSGLSIASGVAIAGAVDSHGASQAAKASAPMSVNFDQPLPPPLPVARRVAIFPEDKSEELLESYLAGKSPYVVIGPAATLPFVKQAGISNPARATHEQRLAAFAVICDRTKSDLVFGSEVVGAPVRLGDTKAVGDLLAYSCDPNVRRVVSTDRMTISVPGGISDDNADAAMQLSSQYWANRILMAGALNKQASAK